MNKKITKIEKLTKGSYQHLDAEVLNALNKECPKSETGEREESYSTQIKRLIAPTIKKVEREKAKKTVYIEA